MKKSLLIVFVLLVSVPVCIITWMSVSAYAREKEGTAERLTILARKQLEEIDRLILSHVRNLEVSLREYATVADSTELRRLARNTGIVRQMFLIGRDGTFLHPPEAGEMSANETRFLERAHELELSSILGIRTGESRQDRIDETGWYTWFMGDGLNFIFWKSQGDGELIGVELERIALISSIVAVLPDSTPSDSEEYASRVQVTDARGKVLYQWGAYTPPDETQVLAEIPLSPPLEAWHLKLFLELDLGRAVRAGEYVSLFGGVLSLIIVVVFLAFYFYRENTKIVRAALQKVSFVNQVSHELKTPLTNIRLYAELLEQRLEGEKDRADLGIIVAESRRLGRMINNVLTFARSEKDHFAANSEDAIIDEIIKRVVDSFLPSLDRKHIKVALSCEAPAVINTDVDFVEQILSNLISNVEKYAGSGKYLEIASAQGDGSTSVTVSDRGPGIPAREQKKIFTPFYRISNALTEGISGAGIGLTLSRTLAAIIGGSLTIEKADVGASFRLEIVNKQRGGQP